MNADLPMGKPAGRAGVSARRPPRKLVTILVIAFLTIAGIYAGYQRFAGAPEAPPALQTVPAQTGSLVSTVVTTGSVVATNVAKLSFSAEGKLVEMNVDVGDEVKAGQPLARLDTAPLESKLVSAESALRVAQINLEQLQAGATPEELEAARLAYDLASVRYQETAAGATESELQSAQSAVEQARSSLVSAEAKLEELEAGPSEADLASAQAAVDSARSGLASAEAKLEELQEGATQVDLGSAQAAVDSALTSLKASQTKLETLLAGPTQVELATARAAVDQALSSVTTAEDRLGMAEDGKLVEAGVGSVAAAEASLNSAWASYESAVEKLNDLKVGPLPIDIQTAESAVISAQASYDSAVDKLEQLRKGATSVELATAESAIRQANASLVNAETQLTKLQAGPTEADMVAARSTVEQARSSLSSAQAKLDDLRAGPKESDLLSARSSVISARDQLNSKTTIEETDLILQMEQVRQAEANLEQARLDLESGTIVAPFDGIVSEVGANVGEQVGSNTAVLTVTDPAAIRIDVTVDETDVAVLAAGQQATITFDALPDQSLRGSVISVAPMGTTTQGVVHYPVSVGIDLAQGRVSPGPGGAGRSALPEGQAPSPEQIDAMRDRLGATGGQAPNGRTAPGGGAATTQPPIRYPFPGMSATVNIETERKDGVLLVPNRAVRSQGRDRVVEVVFGEGTEMRQVVVGSSNEQSTEIVSGLEEGDQVVIPGTTTAQPRTGFGVPGTGGGGMGQQPAVKVVR